MHNGTVSIVPPTTSATSSTTSPYTTKTKVVSGTPKIVTKQTTVTSSPTPTHSHKPGLAPQSQDSSSSGGLSTGATIAIAVVVPIVVIALLILLLIFCIRRRKHRKIEEEQRRKEVEEYGYNPNHDATLPAVGGIGSDSPEMSEDATGYRGWGNNTNGGLSARKTSTNISSNMGMTMSEDGRGMNPASPPAAHLAGDGYAEGSGAAVATGIARRASNKPNGSNGDNLQRGLSNASSFSAGRTDESGDILGGGHQDYGYGNNYSQYAPYQAGGGNQPIIRDVNARRNTKIENATYPQQGNSGIAQNF